ncbi:MAG: histidine kinase [Actinomycetota bacterium]|nr:histidine kinase [Actinomycetota bacterium]
MRLRRAEKPPRLKADRYQRWVVVRQVGQFVALAVLAVVLVGVATAIASRRAGEREAITDRSTEALIKAQSFVEPVITEGLLTAEPAAVELVAEVVETSVLTSDLIRVKIWTADGLIVYSDEPRLEGEQFDLGVDERKAISDGLLQAEISDLAEPENIYELDQGRLLEVYLPVRTPSGQRLLFEAYFRYDSVLDTAERNLLVFGSISVGALIALQIVQVPIAWSLANRLRQRQREREGLLRQALEASDIERRRIASDLHDGVVQDLAGVAYSLAGAARTDGRDPATAALLGDAATEVRTSITALRSLLVQIYPPNLSEEGLVPVLTDLIARAQVAGLRASLDSSRFSAAVPEPVAGLAYRATQEALRNVVSHSRAGTADVWLATEDHHLVLEVSDDGIGFDPTARPVSDPHFGLRGLAALAKDAGGSLAVQSAPGEGTTLTLRLPLR